MRESRAPCRAAPQLEGARGRIISSEASSPSGMETAGGGKSKGSFGRGARKKRRVSDSRLARSNERRERWRACCSGGRPGRRQQRQPQQTADQSLCKATQANKPRLSGPVSLASSSTELRKLYGDFGGPAVSLWRGPPPEVLGPWQAGRQAGRGTSKQVAEAGPTASHPAFHSGRPAAAATVACMDDGKGPPTLPFDDDGGGGCSSCCCYCGCPGQTKEKPSEGSNRISFLSPSAGT